MLKTRVITALVLIGLLLPAIFLLPAAAWAYLVAAFVGIAAWEWGALLGWREQSRRLLGLATAALCSLLAYFNPEALGAGEIFQPAQTWVWVFYVCSAFLWCVLMPFWLRYQWVLGPLSGVLVGALVLLPTWLAMVQLRVLGAWALLAVFAIAWVADIAAYFAGRAFGRHKLAPSISPGKTREGAYGACLGVLVYGMALRLGFDWSMPPLVIWLVGLLFITAISIVGDLFESLLKRKAGIKDSSNILPGHGGVLDRIDSLTSTLPLAALFWLLFIGLPT